MKKINKKGFTLVELLAVISVLAIISVIISYTSANVIDSAKLKSYLTSSSNIEKTSELYVTEENSNIIWKDNSINTELEYTCVIVKDLIETGYFKSDVLDSMISKDRYLMEDDYVYIERNKNNKSITKNTLLIDLDDPYITSCIANKNTGKINISISPSGWSKEKDALINYELIKFNGDYSDYKYEYSYIDDNYSDNFNKKIISKNVDINNNGYLNALIKDKDNNVIVSKTLGITKIDNIDPEVKLLVTDGNIYKQTNSINLKLIDNESGLKKGSYDVYYQWSLSDLSCSDLLNSSNSEKVSINVSKDGNKESETITKNISKNNGIGNIYACFVNVSDVVENEINNVLVNNLMYLDNEKPVITLGNYTGNSEVKNIVSIPIVVEDKYSGVNSSSFTSNDVIVKIGDKNISSGITLNKIDDNNYNLIINNSTNSGNIKIIIDSNNILDNAGNGNEYTEIDTSITFKNTYMVSYDANGGSGAPSSQVGIIGNSITISDVVPLRTGYTFLGWSTTSSATSATYQSGSNFVTDKNTTLYAVWKINTYTLSISKGTGVSTIYYKVNGASGYISSSSNVSTSVNYGATYSYYGVASTGYTMSSCTASNPCQGTVGMSNISKKLSANANSYNITYNANGGSGAPSNQIKTYGVTLTLSTTKPTRNGYIFLGWSTSSSATSATYKSGGSFTDNANTTLYAVWKDKDSIPSCAISVSSGSTTLTATYSSSTGVTGYYFGTTMPTSSTTFISMSSSKKGTVTGTVSRTGTYYFGFKNAYGDIGYCSGTSSATVLKSWCPNLGTAPNNCYHIKSYKVVTGSCTCESNYHAAIINGTCNSSGSCTCAPRFTTFVNNCGLTWHTQEIGDSALSEYKCNSGTKLSESYCWN